jgi:V8-like Glu-specific endopeptidase
MLRCARPSERVLRSWIRKRRRVVAFLSRRSRAMRQLLLAICWIAPALSACSGESPAAAPVEVPANQPHIVGGVPAEATEVFATVAVWGKTFESPICTGTLVAPTVVVTATHCLLGFPASEIGVVAGVLDARSPPPGSLYSAATVTTNPSFVQPEPADEDGLGNAYDIGVITLENPVTTLDHVEILAPGQVDTALSEGTPVVISGYGSTSLQAPDVAGELYVAETPYRRRTQWEFIAGQSGSPDTCWGDSGGPAYAKLGDQLVLAGVTSRAISGSKTGCGDGSIYTLVPAFLDFVTQSAGGGYPAPAPEPEPEPKPEVPGPEAQPPPAGQPPRPAGGCSGCSMVPRDGTLSAWASLATLCFLTFVAHRQRTRALRVDFTAPSRSSGN